MEMKIDFKVTFDSNLVNRFLTFSRIMEPSSKLEAYNHLKHYYEKLQHC